MSHVARNEHWLEWLLRILILCVALYEALLFVQKAQGQPFFSSDNYSLSILAISALTTTFILSISFRQVVSWIITSLNLIISGQILAPLFLKQIGTIENFRKNRIFVSNSFPHTIALFVYITVAAYALLCIGPHTSITSNYPNPITVRQLLSFGGLAFIVLALCGVGIFVTRSYKETFSRLSLLKPNKVNIAVGIFVIFASFAYDWCWIVYTHNLGGQDIATRLCYYNPDTFTSTGSFLPSVILAILITICAAIGEEILIRGALQPVFGILPSALLHGLIHGLFAHTAIFVIQVALWSICMGLVRRYTNVSTTIIGHAGFNVFTIILFALNP